MKSPLRPKESSGSRPSPQSPTSNNSTSNSTTTKIRSPGQSPPKQTQTQKQQQKHTSQPRSPYKSPYKPQPQLWEMDDDAFLDAMSGPFMSPELPKDVKDVEIEEYHETILRRYNSPPHHYYEAADNYNNDEYDSCGDATRSISTFTSSTLSKSMSDSSSSDDDETTDEVGEEILLDDDYYYHVNIPITPHGLLLMLKPKIAKDWVMFDGYAQQPDGSPGPAERMQLFRNPHDVILSMDNIPLQGLGFTRTLELLQELIHTKRQQQYQGIRPLESSYPTLPTITFRMMDITSPPATTTTTTKKEQPSPSSPVLHKPSKRFYRFKLRQRFHTSSKPPPSPLHDIPPPGTTTTSSVQVVSTDTTSTITTDTTPTAESSSGRSSTLTPILIHTQ